MATRNTPQFDANAGIAFAVLASSGAFDAAPADARKHYLSALKHLEKAIEGDPKLEIYNTLGIVRTKLARYELDKDKRTALYEAAREDYVRAGYSSTDTVLVDLNLAEVNLFMNAYKEAAVAANKASNRALFADKLVASYYGCASATLTKQDQGSGASGSFSEGPCKAMEDMLKTKSSELRVRWDFSEVERWLLRRLKAAKEFDEATAKAEEGIVVKLCEMTMQIANHGEDADGKERQAQAPATACQTILREAGKQAAGESGVGHRG